MATNEGMGKPNVVYVYNADYSALKRKEILTRAPTWMTLYYVK
jgi:hypothetical protein